MGIAAPVIEAEMAEWVALGGGNSGIVADPRTHSFGFHLDALSVGPDDYSRWRDPNGADGPYVDWRYCCAGDFSHGGDERLRAMQRAVLARLMSGQLPMICEFIGKPWADQPVYYWARWNGVGTLQRYTGAGHDHWSHISWYRSRVDERAYLWTTAPTQEDGMPIYARTKANQTVWVSNGLRRRPVSAMGSVLGTVQYVDSEAALTDMCGPPETATAVDVPALAKALAPLLDRDDDPTDLAPLLAALRELAAGQREDTGALVAAIDALAGQ